jgi:NAD(P)-dependent dehydrogenase (short-subunit alcohol dehydrogenase family)
VVRGLAELDGLTSEQAQQVANVMGVPAFTVYAASKAAVRSFARGWTMELKDRKIRG